MWMHGFQSVLVQPMRDLNKDAWEVDDSRSTTIKHSRTPCETDESYRNVLATSEDHRIAICRHGIQWLFQRRRPLHAGAGGRWDNIGYCLTRAGLMRLQRSENAQLEEFIEALPEKFTAQEC